ncbi:type II toxin-antitoxin system VapC family toxin [Belnapia rosea]|uniref:type II toxin-antitoxin system VapC family toxin n=1 Tax=Belnapia rosea TaxID=938405 RepID=UPI00210CCA50|nr:PIN domain-containing protein [Belnapia rosea]
MVDSSVWIGNLRGDLNDAVVKLHAMDFLRDRVIVPDLVLVEVLRGANSEANAARIERDLRQFEIVQIGGERLSVDAARHYRHLRGMGVTIRSTVDLMIGAFCIWQGCFLLHHDRKDFRPMEQYLGLRCL